MTQPDKLMSIEECDRVIANHKSGVQLTQVALYQQLADTMRENEKLRAVLKEISHGDDLLKTLNGRSHECFMYQSFIAHKALSNKDSDNA